MAETPLVNIFGASATQTATTLTIAKADFASKGLTPTSDNSAESLLAAILFFSKDNLTATNQSANPQQSITITEGFESLSTQNNQNYREKTLNVNLRKIDTTSALSANDY